MIRKLAIIITVVPAATFILGFLVAGIGFFASNDDFRNMG